VSFYHLAQHFTVKRFFKKVSRSESHGLNSFFYISKFIDKNMAYAVSVAKNRLLTLARLIGDL